METEHATLRREQSNGEKGTISQEKITLLLNSIYGDSAANPNPDKPHKPGPWDPILRKVSKQLFGPSPEPWKSRLGIDRLLLNILAERNPAIYDVIGGGRFDWVALNPQPLPPKEAFIVAFTEEVLDRILLMQEIADGLKQNGQEQGIIIVSGKLSQLVDELCPRPFKFPFPGPKHEFDQGLSGLDLILAATICEKTAASCANLELQNELKNTGFKLMEEGISRL